MKTRQRVVIHAGFHKTGTSSAQAMLRENRGLLRRYIRFYLKWKFESVTQAARGFSTWRDDLSREKFRWRFARLLEGTGADLRKPLLLSSEEFSGHLPGRQGLADYSAAPLLAADLATAVYQHFGADTDLTFVYTTRNPRDWLRSAYIHHVTRSDLTLSYDEYLEKFGASADLDDIADRVQQAVGLAKVVTYSLEFTKRTRLGPCHGLIEAMDLPETVVDALVPVSRRNTAPSAGDIELCLELNRSDMPRKHRQARKQALIGE